MIEIEPPEDRAVLVSAPRRGTEDDTHAEEHLEELARLADTAGAVIVDRIVQRVTRPTPRTRIGAGKLAALKARIEEDQATLAIFDDELTPVQGKNLETELGVRVMDRAELILDIFATRARTNEARMQVQLAQLEYLLPRLARMWVHLSRIRGGIGLRGPGETQLETDRRMIRRKISQLKKKLEKVARHRETIRQGRRDIVTAALVGYTNAGKSSVLRAMTGAKTRVEDRLFATLDTLTREAFIPPDGRVRLIDTVGFIRKLPHHLVASFRATLEETTTADVLLHIIDAADPDWLEHAAVVERVVSELELPDAEMVRVFNKMDAVEDRVALEFSAHAHYPRAVFISAARGDVGELQERLAEYVEERRGVTQAG